MRQVVRRGYKKPSSSRLSISRFKGVDSKVANTLLPLDRAELFYNLRNGSGALTTGYGIDIAKVYETSSIREFESQPLRVWLYSQGYYSSTFIVHCKDGYFYEIGRDGMFITPRRISSTVKISGDVTAINYRYNGEDVFIFSEPYGTSMYIYDGFMVTKYTGAPNIKSMVVHYERVFATTFDEPKKLWFSDDFDPTCWDISLNQAGFIEMADERGDMLKVVSFLDYIYVFREFGISRVTAYGDQSQYAVSQLYTDMGRIIDNTVTECGDRIIMLASDGLYSFDGLSARKILPELDELFDEEQQFAVGTYCEGKFYLGCRIKYSDEYPVVTNDEFNNTLLVYDLNTGEVSMVRGLPIRFFTTSKSYDMAKILVLINDTSYKNYLCELTMDGLFFGEQRKCLWRSGRVDLGYPDRDKSIKSVSLTCKHDALMRVGTENGIRTVHLSGCDSPQRFPICLKGKTVRVEFESLGGEDYIAGVVFDMSLN